MTSPDLLKARLTHLIKDYVPTAAVARVVNWIIDYKIKVTVTGKRKSVYGDYRNPDRRAGHRISVNGDLNKYAFLITFIHEMAHLIVWEQHRNDVRSHGREWKQVYKNLMSEFFEQQVFPRDITEALREYMNNPAASSCTDNHLTKVIARYNDKPILHVEDLAAGELFEAAGGRIFRLENKLRTRYRCVEVRTAAIYLFSAVAEVKRVKVVADSSQKQY